MRPLTAADRVPQVGDVMILASLPDDERTVDEVHEGHISFADDKGAWYNTFIYGKRWNYISRADGGLITTEAP